MKNLILLQDLRTVVANAVAKSAQMCSTIVIICSCDLACNNCYHLTVMLHCHIHLLNCDLPVFKCRSKKYFEQIQFLAQIHIFEAFIVQIHKKQPLV